MRSPTHHAPTFTGAESAARIVSSSDQISSPTHRAPTLTPTESFPPRLSFNDSMRSPTRRAFALPPAESAAPKLSFSDAPRSSAHRAPAITTDTPESAPSAARRVSFSGTIPSPTQRAPALITDTAESIERTSSFGKSTTLLAHHIPASPQPTRGSVVPDCPPKPRPLFTVTNASPTSSPTHSLPAPAPMQTPSIAHTGTPSHHDPRAIHPPTEPLRGSVRPASSVRTYLAHANPTTLNKSNSGSSQFTSVSQLNAVEPASQPLPGQSWPKFGAECSSLTNDVLVHTPPPQSVLDADNFSSSRWRTK
eukprot:GEMP01028862.1.p1 GENE.GEMP01028862.1~~GEMP01028862.1.p1  ORF type:complete len:307 (+),score=57.51 GEMP01028862.1:976-1896(+)